MSSPPQPRKGKGRRKLNMEKIENQGNLQVTFSKRRSGLFKKANELCTLTGAEAGLVVFSPTEKAFSFGHPNVDTIVDRFTHHNSPYSNFPTTNNNIQFPHEGSSNATYTRVERILEAEKKYGEELNQMLMAPEIQELVPSIDELGPQEFDQINRGVHNFENRLDQLYQVANATNGTSSYHGTGGGLANNFPGSSLGTPGYNAMTNLFDQGTNGK